MWSISGRIFVACILLSACHGLPDPLAPRSKPEDTDWIRGGDVAARGQFSYVLSIRRSNVAVCGGSFVDSQFIVTAAHCVVQLNGTFFTEQPTIFASVVDVAENKVYSVEIKVKEVVVLNAYKPEIIRDGSLGRVEADIAVMKLKDPINDWLDEFVTKLELPKASSDYTGKIATIVGYGWDQVIVYTDSETGEKQEYGDSGGQLLYAEATVISNEQCKQNMSSIHKSNLCAKVTQREKVDGRGVCSGDSGGPLVINETLIGVLSSSPIGCIEDKGSGVYTRVSSYRDFIEAYVCNIMTQDMRIQTFK